MNEEEVLKIINYIEDKNILVNKKVVGSEPKFSIEYCPNCGNKVKKNEIICPICGIHLDE